MKGASSTAELLLRIDRSARLPLRLQLEQELRHAIQAGRLAAGALVPATRTLATDLGLSRGLVVEAYEQLLAEGYLTAHRGSATRVAPRSRAHEPDPRSREGSPVVPRYDFRPGLPDLGLFPRRAWLGSMRRALGTAADTAFDYPDPRGPERARVALAAYLNRARATRALADRVVFSSGSAQAIGLLCHVLRARGVRRMAVEEPGHADQCTDIQAAGLQTPRIPVDEHGIRTDRLNRTNAGAVLVTPAHQYPTGAVLSPERRAALLEWAGRRGAFIVEDDYDAEYRYDRDPIGALQGVAPDRVVYVGSASKILSPALRIGWTVAPADVARDLARLKLQADRGAPGLELLALADFLERGELDRHLRATRHIYRRRRNILVDALKSHLPDVCLRGVAAGLHLMIELAPAANEPAVVEAAARRSIRLYGARAYYASREIPRPGIVVGYGGLAEPAIRPAVRELVQVLEETGAA